MGINSVPLGRVECVFHSYQCLNDSLATAGLLDVDRPGHENLPGCSSCQVSVSHTDRLEQYAESAATVVKLSCPLSIKDTL